MRDAFNEGKDNNGGTSMLGRGRSQGGVKHLSLLKGFGYMIVGMPIEPDDMMKLG